MNRSFSFRANPPWSELPRTSALVSGRARRYHAPDFTTTLSLKTVVRGSGRWRTPLGTYRLEPGRFLLLNHGQTYTLDVESAEVTETLCLFFQPGFLEVAAGARRPPERLLDDPAREEAVGFVERLHADEGRLTGVLSRLRGGPAGAMAEDGLEDGFYQVAEVLMDLREEVRREMDALPALRAATRVELYRRLHRARDYADSCLAEDLTVDRLARVACLSPFHFQRVFKTAFGVSPMRYVQERRLEAARALLLGTDRPVGEVCAAVGFMSLGSFSWLFRRRFGASPAQIRRAR